MPALLHPTPLNPATSHPAPCCVQAINSTSAEQLLEESDVHDMLVRLHRSSDNVKAKVQRILDSQSKIDDVRAQMQQVRRVWGIQEGERVGRHGRAGRCSAS